MSTHTASLPLAGPTSTHRSVAIAWMAGLIGLALAGWLAQSSEVWGWSNASRIAAKSAVFCAFVFGAVWWLQRRFERIGPAEMGLPGPITSVAGFAAGVGIFVVPMAITLIVNAFTGWGEVQFNFNASVLSGFGLALAAVFFFEALPEEFLLRGYIYSSLSKQHRRWVAYLATVALFVLFPVALTPIQQHLLGLEIQLGGGSALTMGYLINMLLFGAFVGYLRVLTGSIWMGVGFHTAFVLINHLIGQSDSVLIQFTGFESEQPLQLVLISSLAIVFMSLLLYPKLAGRRLGWGERAT